MATFLDSILSQQTKLLTSQYHERAPIEFENHTHVDTCNHVWTFCVSGGALRSCDKCGLCDGTQVVAVDRPMYEDSAPDLRQHEAVNESINFAEMLPDLYSTSVERTDPRYESLRWQRNRFTEVAGWLTASAKFGFTAQGFTLLITEDEAHLAIHRLAEAFKQLPPTFKPTNGDPSGSACFWALLLVRDIKARRVDPPAFTAETAPEAESWSLPQLFQKFEELKGSTVCFPPSGLERVFKTNLTKVQWWALKATGDLPTPPPTTTLSLHFMGLPEERVFKMHYLNTFLLRGGPDNGLKVLSVAAPVLKLNLQLSRRGKLREEKARNHTQRVAQSIAKQRR